MAVTLGAQAIKFFIGLGVTMVLGRLLTPKDYGLVAMVGVITGFISVFKDGGLSTVTVQRASITEAQISTLFWINVALGTGTALLVASLSPFVSWFYNDKSLTWIVVALAVPFILSGLTAQHQALLQREMRFKAIAFIEIASLIISASVGIVTAANGLGSWALVIMSIASAAANTAFVFFICRWRPSRPVRGIGLRSMIKFGGELTVNKFFDSLACSMDSLLLGKFFTADMVGLYTRAQSLMLLPLSQIMPALLSVSLPVMSRLAERSETLKGVFLDLLQLTVFTSSFITVFLVVGADWLIGIFLGPRWMEVSDVLRLLAGPCLFIPLSTLCVASLTARGRGTALMRWSFQKNIITIFAMFAGIAWGAKGVAAALSIASVCILMPILYNITSQSGLASLKEIWGVIGPGVGVCIFACGFFFFIRHQLELENPLIGLLVLSLINGIFHVLIMGTLPSSRRALARTISVISSSRTA